MNYFADTHEVQNQSGALENYNLYGSDQALGHFTAALPDTARQRLTDFGQLAGQADYLLLGQQANAHKPQFRTHNRFGERVDEVEFHPAYHRLMQTAIGHQLHSLPWREKSQYAHQLRAALYYQQAQVEAGHGCPITMTFAAVPTLNKQPELAALWLPKVTAAHYDPANKPWYHKNGLTLGMAMTEKQGGSDVRANSTRAYPVGQPGEGQLYELAGHKYFVSAPMSDAFLVLAYAEAGLSCFLVPRWRPDGSKNPLQIQQLKNKLGNVSNASAETELRGALGWLIGDEGRGVANILEMVALTRFDCMIGSSAGQRAAVAQAIHHCQHRSAFGAKLTDQPLMQAVLADLALESEASLALTLRMAQCLDNPTDHNRALLRIGTAVGKYWICKRTPGHAYEAMECIGGMGVMDDGPLARLYREAPINAIWEGSGNVQCLDLLRVLDKHPECLAALWQDWQRFPALRHWQQQLQKLFRQPASQILQQARPIMEQLALGASAAALLQLESPLADAYINARLLQGPAGLYGCLPSAIDSRAIIQRASPH